MEPGSTQNRAAALCCLAVTLGLTPVKRGLSSPDAYLSALEDEARSATVDPQTTSADRTQSVKHAPEPASTPATGPSNSDNARAPARMSPDAFRQDLAERFAGTYAFYQQLAPDMQKQVFDLYTTNASIGEIRTFILRLYTQR